MTNSEEVLMSMAIGVHNRERNYSSMGKVTVIEEGDYILAIGKVEEFKGN